MSKTITIEVGGKERKLKFGHGAAQAATDECNRNIPFSITRLQIADVCNLALKGDTGAVQVLLRHGVLDASGKPDRTLTAEKVYRWIDERLDPDGYAGDLSYFSIPIAQALIAAGVVKAEAVVLPEASDEALTQEAGSNGGRPPLAAVPSGSAASSATS